MSSDRGKPAQKLSVVEWISAPAGAVNDDRAGYAGSYVWVIDGATDCVGERYLPGKSDAAWLAGKFHHGFSRRAPAASVLLPDLIEEITRSVRDDFHREAIRELSDRGHQPSAAALIGRLQGGALEVAGLGDCQLFIAQPRKPARLCAPGRSRLGDRAAIERIRAAMTEQDLPWLAARAMLKPCGDEGRRLMNTPDGYGVLSIDMAPPGLIHGDIIPLESGARLLLATDGFTRLYEIFDTYKEETLLEAAFEKGLAALIAQLRALEGKDAACEKAPRLKPSDDATAILVIAE